MSQEYDVNLNLNQLSEKLTSPLALEPGMLTGFSAYIEKYLGDHFTPPNFEKIVKLTAKRSEQITKLIATSKNDVAENQTRAAVTTILSDALDSKQELPDLSIQKICLLFATFQQAFNAKNPEDIAVLKKFVATVNSDQFVRGNKKIAPYFINDMAQLFHNLHNSIGIYLGGNTNSENQSLNTAGSRYEEFNRMLVEPSARIEYQVRPPTSTRPTTDMDISVAPL